MKKLTSMNTFDVFMVLALGLLAGTGAGLAIGSIVKKYYNPISMTSSYEITLNLALAAVCSCISLAILCWLSLV